VVDYRGEASPLRMLERVRAQDAVQVWSEATARVQVAGQDRLELGPSKSLVLWTTPPGPNELQAALERVSPETVYVFGIDPGLDHPERFLKRLSGLVKSALNSSRGRASISTLAAATAQREATVRAGIAWLVSRGHVAVLEEDGDEIRLDESHQTKAADLPGAGARLRALLEETAAYRAHFARAAAQTLLGRRKSLV